MAMGDQLKWLFKEGWVDVFSRVAIFLSKIRPPHRQLVYRPIYIHNFFLSCTCVCNSFVSSGELSLGWVYLHSAALVLLCCFLT